MKPIWLLLAVLFLSLGYARKTKPTQLEGGSIQQYLKNLQQTAIAEITARDVNVKNLNTSHLLVNGITEIQINSVTKLKATPVKTRFTVSPLDGNPVSNLDQWDLGITECADLVNCVADNYPSDLPPGTLGPNTDVEFQYDMAYRAGVNQIMFAVTASEGLATKGAGYVFFETEDINAKVIKTGKEEDGKVALRVEFERNSGGIEFSVAGESCPCTIAPCYRVGLNPTSTVDGLCMDVTDMNSKTFSMCDEVVPESNEFDGIEDTLQATLTYKETGATLVFETTYTTPTSPQEVDIVYYKATETPCQEGTKCTMTDNTCTVDLPTAQTEAGLYHILVVNKGQLATGSNLYDFEDYMTELIQLSDNTVEVRWTVIESNAEFNIKVDDSPIGKVSCIDTKCLGYVNTFGTSAEHTVTVEKTSPADGSNIVGATKQLVEGGGTAANLATTKMLKTAQNAVKTTIDITIGGTVSSIGDITLALLAAGSPGTQYVYQDTSVTEITGSATITFLVDSAALAAGQLTVVVVAHGPANEVLASGETTIELKAINTVMDSVGADLLTDSMNSLRVNTDLDVTVDGIDCPPGSSYVLGINAPDASPVEVCDATVSELELCDGTRSVNPFKGPVDVTSITVSSYVTSNSKIQIVGAFDQNSATMDLIFYETDEKKTQLSCDATANCESALDRSLLTPLFQLLMVALTDSETVTESHAVNFEDYETTATQLTVDLIEVRWVAKDETVYKIYLDKQVPDAYDAVTVTCGASNNDKCKAFFMMLLEPTYVASVKLNTDGDLNIVAAQVVMEQLAEALTIISLTLDDQGETLQAKVCFQDHSGGTNNYELNMIDRSGKVRTSQIGNADHSCITGPVLDTTFSTASEVRVLVTSEDGTNRTAGDVDLFLLDPNLQTGNAPMSVKQVGQTTLRVKWTNLNNAFNYQIAHDALQNTPVQCAFRKECGGYVHLDNPQGSVAVTLTENGTVQQIVTTSVDIQTSIQDIVISSISTRYDNRIQVCFDAPTDVASYELGLEVSNELLEATEDPQIINGDNGASCVLSDNTVELGAYVELWCLVSAYDDAGNLKASGVQLLKSIFLSASRAVYGAVSNTSLISSWHLLDSVQGINQITVYLKALTDQGANVINTVNFAPNVTSHIFDISEGKYTICVQASTADLYSEETCSDIIKVLAGQDVVVPPVETTPPKTTSDNEVLVTWHPPQDEDVTGFLVSWSEILGLQASRYALNSPEVRNGLFTPLDLVGAVSKPRAVGETGFMIVSASETSVEITGLTSGSKYSLCVASVKEDMVGSQDCNESDLSQYEQLDAPTNLNYFDNGTISWQGDESSTYLVQWQSKTDTRERGFTEINGTTYEKTFVPGQWAIEVRTVTKTSSSEATGATLFIAGLVTYAKQSQETSLIATWYEEETQTSMISDLNEKLYEIRVLQNGISIGSPVPVYCSAWLAECSYEIHNLNMSFTDEVTVSVTDKDANINANYVLKIRDFTEIAMLSKTVRSSNDVEVAWNEVPEAEGYKITLYKAVPSNEIKYQDFIPMNQIQLTEDNMHDNVFTVQACKGEEHCGNLAHITLAQDPGDNGPSKTTVIIASTVSAVVGVALILVIVAAVMRNKSKKSKTRGNRGSGEEPIYDTWGKRPLGQSKKRADPQELPRAPSSRENYGIPSTFDVHS